MTGRDDRIHVLHVVRTLGDGGGMEKNLYRLVVALNERGFRHSILLMSHRTDIIDFGEHAPLHRITAESKDRTVPFQVRQLIAQLRPNVVHARNWAAWPDTALARIACRPRPPLVFSFHGLESTKVPLERRLAFQAMAKITTEIYSVSHAAKDFLVTEYGLPRERIGVLHNGVDTSRFDPPPFEAKPGRLVIGGMGRLYHTNVKNFPLLISSAARVVKQGLDVEVRIAGHGPDHVALGELAEQLGIRDRVHFLGHVDDVPGFLADVDVFVLSSDTEAMPNALLEAMAMARPCVATAVGGVVEIVEPGYGGSEVALMVPKGDEVAMGDAIAALVRDPERRRAIGANARLRAVHDFSTEAMFDRYERMYRDVARP